MRLRTLSLALLAIISAACANSADQPTSAETGTGSTTTHPANSASVNANALQPPFSPCRTLTGDDLPHGSRLMTRTYNAGGAECSWHTSDGWWVMATVTTTGSARADARTTLDALYKGARAVAADPQDISGLGEEAFVDSAYPGLLAVRFTDAVVNVLAKRNGNSASLAMERKLANTIERRLASLPSAAS